VGSFIVIPATTRRQTAHNPHANVLGMPGTICGPAHWCNLLLRRLQEAQLSPPKTSKANLIEGRANLLCGRDDRIPAWVAEGGKGIKGRDARRCQAVRA